MSSTFAFGEVVGEGEGPGNYFFRVFGLVWKGKKYGEVFGFESEWFLNYEYYLLELGSLREGVNDLFDGYGLIANDEKFLENLLKFWHDFIIQL